MRRFVNVVFHQTGHQRRTVMFAMLPKVPVMAGPGSVAMGLAMLAGGIVVINVNERRAVKQEQLNQYCEAKTVSINADSSLNSEAKIDQKLVHAYGEVEVKDPWATDRVLGAVAKGVIRLKRETSMYQFKEHEEEHVDKNGNKTTTYTYSKEWSSEPLKTVDRRNPAFPKWANEPCTEPGRVEMLVNKLRLTLSSSMIKRLEDWSMTNVTVDDESFGKKYGLVPVTRQGWFSSEAPQTVGFYTKGNTIETPEVGDIRVTYKAVLPGPHTLLGKYTKKDGVVPFKATLTNSLASEAAIIVPEEANKLSEELGAGSMLVIPDWVTSWAEQAVLNFAPLEYAFIDRGEYDKASTFYRHQFECIQNTFGIALFGAACCVFGCTFAGGAATKMVMGLRTIGGATGLVSGSGIAWSTYTAAHEQATKLPQKNLKVASNGKGDVEF